MSAFDEYTSFPVELTSPKANMKVITAIYLNCRPDLRDEWLTTIDVDSDLDESLVSCASLSADDFRRD